MRLRVMGVVMAVVTVSACGDGSTPVDYTPRQFAPGAPGFLDLGPEGITLAPGESRQLSLLTYDADGNTLANSQTLSWSSSNPATATVDSNGVVRAAAEGDIEITVNDGAHGSTTVSVAVSATKPQGPAGIRFTPAFVTLSAGQSGQVSFTITDATGAVVAGISPVFSSSNPAVSMDATGKLTTEPKKAALAYITATVGSVVLSGALTVVSYPFSTAPCFQDPPAPVAVACGLVAPPVVFPTPHAKPETLRIQVARVGCYGGRPYPWVIWTDAPPTRVRFTTPGVVGIDAAGDLAPLQMGRTSMLAFYEDIQCRDPVRVSVDPDLTGTWAVNCANGDHGSWSRARNFPYTRHARNFPTLGELGYLISPGSGFTKQTDAVGGFCNDKDGFNCGSQIDISYNSDFGSGAPDRQSVGGTPPVLAEGPCSTSNVCPVQAVGACNPRFTPSATPPPDYWFFDGPGHATRGICTLTRGAPVSSCSAATQCDGTYTINIPPVTCGDNTTRAFTGTVVVSQGHATFNFGLGTSTTTVDENCIARASQADACGTHTAIVDLKQHTQCQIPFDVTLAGGICECSTTATCNFGP